MDKSLAIQLNTVINAPTWVFFERYLKQELDRAYVKFDSAHELQDFSTLQSEIRVLKKILNLKESIRQSIENA